jgi:hypothetical protein
MNAVRTMVARLMALAAFACGVIGLVAGLTGHSWKLGPEGWFVGGVLLAVLGVFMLVDGAAALAMSKG